MHNTGSVILTVIERMRELLDEPAVDSKYNNDYVVRHALGPGLVDVVSRLNNTISCPVINTLSITLDTDQQYYKLPPCVQEVLRLSMEDSDGELVWDFFPRDRMDWRGAGWSLEGGPGALSLKTRPSPTSGTTLVLHYSSNGDCLPHYSADGGASDSYQISVASATFTHATRTLTKSSGFTNYTFREGDKITVTTGTGATLGDYEVESRTDDDNIVLKTSIGSGADGQTDIGARLWVWYLDLDTSPNYGGLDRRDSAYVGQSLRILHSSGRHFEAIITESGFATNSVWRVKTRHPFDAETSPSAIRYEIVPMGSTALASVVAARAALEIGIGRKISDTHRGAIKESYRMSLKTLGDNLTCMQALRPPAWEKATVQNPNTSAWAFGWPGS